MRILFIFIFLLSSVPIFAKTEFWIGADLGKSFSSLKGEESSESSSYLGAKAYLSASKGYWLLDLGLGFNQHNLDIEYKSGKVASGVFNSTNTYLYIAPRFLLSSKMSLGWENQILLGTPIRTGQETEQNIFSGLGLMYHSNIDRIKTRIGLSVNQGLNLDKDTKLVLLSFHISYDSPDVKNKKRPDDSGPISYSDSTYFNFDKSSLTDPDLINQLAEVLNHSMWEKITIEGHTDRIGKASYNKVLGEKRALAVKESLTAKGVDDSKIVIIAKGEDELLDKEFTPEAHARNRRVVIKILFNPDKKINKKLLDFSRKIK